MAIPIMVTPPAPGPDVNPRQRGAEELAMILPVATTRIRNNAALYKRYWLYYRGIHRLVFASQKWRNAFGYIFQQFSDNLCPTVVNVLADRLQVKEFEADDNAIASTVDAANAVWKQNKMDRLAGECMMTAIKQGDAYMIVQADPRDPTGKRVRFYPQRPEVMTVEYDPEDHENITWAAKCWKIPATGRHRLVIFFPEGEYHFITREKSTDGIPCKPIDWEPFITVDTGTNVILKDENLPQRVPVFHFANDAECGGMGVSELANVLPLQDALNKAVMDMMVAMEFVSLPQRFATGIELDINADSGEPEVPFEPGAETIFATESEKAKFGQFDAANLEQLIKVQDAFRVEVARVSGTPLHHFMLQTGNAPSGEALRALEARLIKKAKDRQTSWGDVWETVVGYALALAGEVDGEVALCTKWDDAAPTSDKEIADTVKVKRDIGVSWAQAMRELGYTDEQIVKMQDEKTSEDQASAEAALRAFDRGGPAGSIPGGPNGKTTAGKADATTSGRDGGAQGATAGG